MTPRDTTDEEPAAGRACARREGSARARAKRGGQQSPRALARTWQAVLGRLELEVSRANFETWLAGTSVQSLREGELLVEARSAFRADWLNENLVPVVERCLGAIEGKRVAVQFRRAGDGPAGGARATRGARPPAGPGCRAG